MLDLLAHYLIPRPSNNHKAKLIHTSSLVILIAIFIGLQGLFQFITPKAGSILGYAANINPIEIERLTNIERQNNGLSPLTDNPSLDAAALAKGRDMLAKGYWAHVAPDGTQPWAFFTAVHYDYRYAGENLARDFTNPQSAVNAWMASPSHRENILNSKYKEIGVGVVEGSLDGVDTTIIVQFFGTKLQDSIPTQPLAAAKTVNPSPIPSSSPSPTNSPSPIPIIAQASPPSNKTLLAGNVISPFDATKYLSISLVGILILVVAIDGFLINRRKIFRIAGHYQAHIAFLGMIMILVLIAKAGKII